MISPTLTYAYGTYKGRSCLIAGYQEKFDGSVWPLVIMIDGGELLIVPLSDVKIDPTKLSKTNRV